MQVLTVSNLRKRFNLEAGFFASIGRYVHAVNGVSFNINKNESYGLVGESGCGKTTTARLLVRMYEADTGEIVFRGYDGNTEDGYIVDVRKLKGMDFKRYRERVKYVFQDPARSLNPRMTIYEVLTSGAKWSDKKQGASSLREEAAAILEEVGLSAADLERRPAEFSGGQRQRISIARGLMMKPDLLICDEVVSALDVSIQGQILNLLLDMRNSRKSSGQEISFLFIAHDLKVASYFCDRIGVMYSGEIMEEAPAHELWKKHLHPYTELLFSSVGNKIEHSVEFAQTSGLIQTPRLESQRLSSHGCAFAGRCPHAEERCLADKPPLKEVTGTHLVRCWKQ
ncbi:MAG: ABC transporter ATP-binding protein [Treponema sp.]|jgi:oligopeptide/dipeptide ABC transporter ATP-binding protein|nr:ABC transporter ATP-binding protein [Treponema sp.]